jgi:large subunit ribosomal protein L5e
MAFIKLVKNNAYFKRYQTKYRRRREGKTDYYARKRLIIQDKDKFNTPKYRLVARFSNKYVTAQIVSATLKGDKVWTAAYSWELRKYGLTAGLSNYASAYATGLLLARRILKQFGMDTVYKGVEKVDGNKYDVSEKPADERRPLKVILDVGLAATSIGSRVFGVLKGVTDGGVYVPHSVKKFPGFVPGREEGAKEEYKPEVHRERIFGIHVDKYMKKLKSDAPDAYKRQFSKLDAALKTAKVDSLEKFYTKIHAEIRKDPSFTKKAEKKNPDRKHISKRQKALTLAQRKQRRLDKIKVFQQQQKKQQAAANKK